MNHGQQRGEGENGELLADLYERIRQLELNNARPGRNLRDPQNEARRNFGARYRDLGERGNNNDPPQNEGRRNWRAREPGERRNNERRQNWQNNRGQQHQRGGDRREQQNFRENHDNQQRDDADQNQQGRKGRFIRMGFKFLENLIEKDKNELVVELSGERTQNSFQDYLKTDLSPDIIILICRLMAKLCDADMLECKTKVLIMISSTTFLEHLTDYLLKLFLQSHRDKQRNKLFWTNAEQFWNELFIVCKSLTETIPQKSFDNVFKIVKAVQRNCFVELETVSPIPQEIRANFTALQEKLVAFEKEQQRKQTLKDNGENLNDYEEPPEDFRHLSLYPTAEEITNRNHGFLRKNIIEGGYRNVEHYLDVQFRFLREDFVHPLRTGIFEFMNPRLEGRKRLTSVRIHRKIHFLGPVQTKGKVGTLLKFDFGQNKRKVKYEQTRRFMFGSLLCFTKDNFVNLVFGTIVERDVKLLEKGEIVVEMVNHALIEHEVDYVMVECEVYFEPYFHVMKALQMMDETIFPMSKYIVEVMPETRAPDYLTLNSRYTVDKHVISPLTANPEQWKYYWPNHTQLKLDETQLEAYHSALTQEFAVIQGPPGTGKTYVGLKIVRTLLENASVWNNDKQPILIVCFTNHALDQFLEGLISTTRKIIRIGGQCKNEKLKAFHLIEQRKAHNFSKAERRVQGLSREKRYQLKDKMRILQNVTRELELVRSFEGVISFKNFSSLNLGFEGSWFATATDAQIEEWLLGGRTVEERHVEQQNMQELQQQQLARNQEQHEDSDEDNDNEFFDAEGIIDEDEYDIMDGNLRLPGQYFLDVQELVKKINGNVKALEELQKVTVDPTGMNNLNIYKLQETIVEDEEKLNYLQFRLRECNENVNVNARLPNINNFNLQNPHHLRPVQRWIVYRIWLTAYRAQLDHVMLQHDAQYRQLFREYEEIQQMEDQYIMSKMLVIGMTTTGAAKKQTLLRALKCPIVVVEEAAEVLESHIVVSMTDACKHLILIGDHKQLKPTTADFDLVKKGYNFNISLFERMVKNGVHCSVLGVQHRMCPEVASLIVPTIYPTLENHIDVLHYPPVKGVDKNLYFLAHTNFEDTTEDSCTRKNIFEAGILIELAKYLVLQGYHPEEITILSTYTGQMFYLWQLKKKYGLLKDVKITVVDNFQGEENKIILLSLVRSNDRNNIGFLGTENRVCVALSRAREGLFIVGNMDALTSAAEIWRKIRQSLEKLDAVGTAIPLRCQVHPNNITAISTLKDFQKVAEGGCTDLCGADLVCGHKCKSLCHIMDREHTKTHCFEPCPKVLCELDHSCPKKCYEECGPCKTIMHRFLHCGHFVNLECFVDVDTYACIVDVQAVLPCDHEAVIPCHAEPKTYRCPHPCDTRLECGHQCAYMCHIRKDPGHLEYECKKECPRYRVGCTAQADKHKCSKKCFEECESCEVVVKKVRTVCPHAFQVPCNVDVDTLTCEKPCTKDMACGHRCKKKCNEPCGDCKVKVDKTVDVCGHKLRVLCKDEALRSNCDKKCPLLLPCGHPCTNKCKEKCIEKCTVVVDSVTVAACGHTFRKPCYLHTDPSAATHNELLKHCPEPCNETLKCVHKCSGTCGKCYQGRLHQSCQEKCDATLICGHPCEVPCRQICLPCTKPCSYRCVHTKCKKKCGQDCETCKEPCPRQCEHVRCTRKCGELCNVDPCTEPCPKLLKKCGHPCVGFCGDPCPKLCRICDKEELTDFLFGTEDEPDAVFVALDCGHCIESESLDMWFGQKQDEKKEINMKRCPRCSAPVIKTLRYGNYVKETLMDVVQVKKKFVGDKTENEAKREELLQRVRVLAQRNIFLALGSIYWTKLIERLKGALRPLVAKKFKNVLNAVEADTLNAQVEIAEAIADSFKDTKLKAAEGNVHIALDYADVLLKNVCSQNCRITMQERSDFEAELLRLRRIVQLVTIELTSGFDSVKSKTEIKLKHDYIKEKVYSVSKYLPGRDEFLKQVLKDLNQLVNGGLRISDEERLMIVSALKAEGVTPGHWYKCPNGHPYVITECGRAMQISQCPDCGVDIGGTNHRLLETNAVSTEMAGARHAAWSEQANMANYRF